MIDVHENNDTPHFYLYSAGYYYGLINTFRDTLKEALKQAWTLKVNGHWNDVVQVSKATLQDAFRENVLADS